ncbi:MAG: sigma factor-like helix-turn-helix DNA-binding protein, partial [Synechococcaceae cyanobacterium]
LAYRFGLDGQERLTLAEIGRHLDVSRERVRQVELKALRKLRNLTRR